MVKGVAAGAGLWVKSWLRHLLCDLRQVSELLCASVSSLIGWRYSWCLCHGIGARMATSNPYKALSRRPGTQ